MTFLTREQTADYKTPPRVRFAPSPTGFLHIGGARTALMNWLFARKEHGIFLLRIEDTDTMRSEKRFENDIVESFRWLGIDWDEGVDIGGPCGPYRQSERLHIYERYLTQMLKEGSAYYCFCKKDDLLKERDMLLAQGLPPRYPGRCRTLDAAEQRKNLEAGKSSVIRVRTPDAPIVFHDIIRGEIRFESAILEDFIIAKSVREPLYNFAATIDDYEMKITHVIRGEEHLSNTPRQIVIQKALGLPLPHYAHAPLILNADRSKLSKRFADTALHDYRSKGYLPEAIVNFIALLGWHPTGDRELFTKSELIDAFNLSRVQKSGAVFNQEKLDWINKRYLQTLDTNELLARVEELKPEMKESLRNIPDKTLQKLIALEVPRMTTLQDFGKETDWFFGVPSYGTELLVWKTTPRETTKKNLEAVYASLSKLPDDQFIVSNLQMSLDPISSVQGRGEVLWPLRVALSGKQQSPPPFEIMEVLRKEKTLKRVQEAIQKL